ncbi:uncharacterized protein LOC113312661 [Papaver somniferum]|uniref:uncharacterized protein LOC113312661 n=1 Tax=Papaver somniferum TaxID=3469 RepID=UPI000E6FAD1D|nr:uncharacterized protein LOC113312661 [Papaver somniferum]
METGYQKYHDMKLTPLNIRLTKLYEKIRKDLSPPRPLPAETRDKRDKSKYCNFHKDHGHKTGNCRSLKIEVQRMIDAGKLQEYVKKDFGKGHGHENGAEIRDLGCTKIEFSEADIIGAYSSMNLPHDLIEEHENPIISFSGEVTKAIGKVKIPITVADKSVLGNFLLLDCRAPYNAIVGRDWLHEIESYIGEDAAEPPTIEKLIEVQIGDKKHKITFLGEDLPSHERDGLITLLRVNANVFAWSFAEMHVIDPNVACHRLNIDEKFHPVRQKIRNITQSKKDGFTAEVEKLLEAGFIRPVQYPRWLSNVTPVPKNNGKIRVCIDFTDLNKACPSDPYPLPRIRDLVDATSGLKNAEETYQHLVDHMFKDLIGKTMEVYIDDTVVKSEQKESHFLDLQKMFDILRQYLMKINPTKCSFGLSSGKFLGYLMTHRGIEANPEQIRAIIEMSSPRTKKEVQKLAGRLTSLNCFISRSLDRFKPFFDFLKKTVNFGWTYKCEKLSMRSNTGVGCVILTPEGSRIEKATRLGFRASNNESEYEAAIIGLKAAKHLDAKNVKLVTDYMLVVNQFLGTYIAKEERMALYLDHIRELANEFDQFSIGQRPQLENRHAHALAYLSSAVDTDTTRFVVVDFQELPSISDSHFVLALEHASGSERETTSAQGDTENVDNNMYVDGPVIDDSSSPAENTSDWRQAYVGI